MSLGDIKDMCPLELDLNHSGKARCNNYTCRELIPSERPRVRYPLFAQGRYIKGSGCLDCFLYGKILSNPSKKESPLPTSCLSVEICDRNNCGKCKKTGKVLKKGDFRAKISCGAARFSLSIEPAIKICDPLLKHAGVKGSEIFGADKLPKEMKETGRWMGIGGSGGAKLTVKTAKTQSIAKKALKAMKGINMKVKKSNGKKTK